MNPVRIILRLAISLVVCWGVRLGLALMRVLPENPQTQVLQIVDGIDTRHSVNEWLGMRVENIFPNVNVTAVFSSTAERERYADNRKLLPKLFRSMFEASGPGSDLRDWLQSSHTVAVSGWPVKCWVIEDPQFASNPGSRFSWRGGAMIGNRIVPIRPLLGPLALNLAFWYAAVWGVERCFVSLRARRRVRTGLCVKCRYPKPESASVCPECGTPFSVP